MKRLRKILILNIQSPDRIPPWYLSDTLQVHYCLVTLVVGKANGTVTSSSAVVITETLASKSRAGY